MARTLPPAKLTARTLPWLRAAALGLGLAVAAGAGPVAARPAPVKVLVGTTVSDAAQQTMSPALWSKIVSNWVNAEPIPFSGTPTLDDCRRADADFMLAAPFELRPRLPGMPHSSERIEAVTNLVVTNCVTGDVTYAQHIDLESDPPASQPAGDFEGVPEISWSKTAPAALAKYPVFFPRTARIVQLTPPLALVSITGGVKPGDVLYDYAGADHRPKGPITLTVTQQQGKYWEVMFSTVGSGPRPALGDYVEPAPVKPAIE